MPWSTHAAKQTYEDINRVLNRLSKAEADEIVRELSALYIPDELRSEDGSGDPTPWEDLA